MGSVKFYLDRLVFTQHSGREEDRPSDPSVDPCKTLVANNSLIASKVP